MINLLIKLTDIQMRKLQNIHTEIWWISRKQNTRLFQSILDIFLLVIKLIHQLIISDHFVWRVSSHIMCSFFLPALINIFILTINHMTIYKVPFFLWVNFATLICPDQREKLQRWWSRLQFGLQATETTSVVITLPVRRGRFKTLFSPQNCLNTF